MYRNENMFYITLSFPPFFSKFLSHGTAVSSKKEIKT
jgi:hypothetical protein